MIRQMIPTRAASAFSEQGLNVPRAADAAGNWAFLVAVFLVVAGVLAALLRCAAGVLKGHPRITRVTDSPA